MLLNSTLLLAAIGMALSLASCAAGTPQSGEEACVDVLRDREAFRHDVRQKAEKLQMTMSDGQGTANMEAYPKLQDSKKFLDFQTEVESGENKFAVRLKDCKK